MAAGLSVKSLSRRHVVDPSRAVLCQLIDAYSCIGERDKVTALCRQIVEECPTQTWLTGRGKAW